MYGFSRGYQNMEVDVRFVIGLVKYQGAFHMVYYGFCVCVCQKSVIQHQKHLTCMRIL